MLSPLAKAAATLLAAAEFRHVRRCQDPDCMLWFLDQTRSHRRQRWNMEICGDRHKVKACRARHRQPGERQPG